MTKNITVKRALFIMIFLCLALLLVTNAQVSALDKVVTAPDLKGGKIDPTVSKYPTVTLRDCGFLGMSCLLGGAGTQKATLELTKNTEVCASNCQAVSTITLNEEGALVDDVRFYRIDGNEQTLSSIKSYNFYIQDGTSETEVLDYENQCSITGTYPNGTNIEICSNKQIGSHTEENQIWKPYSVGEIMPVGTYVVKLEGNKRADWTYDWQIQTKGEWISEWAVWDSSFQVGLNYYYHLDNAIWTSQIQADFGVNNLTDSCGGHCSIVAGKRGNAIKILDNSTDYDVLNITNSFFSTGTATISFWFNKSSGDGGNEYGGDQIYGSGGIVDTTKDMGVTYANATNKIQMICGPAVWTVNANGINAISRNVWHNLVITFNSTNTTVWVDGVREINAGNCMGIDHNAQNFFFDGQNADLNARPSKNLSIDEVAVWNRTLSVSEIADLYNGGIGIFFGGGIFVNLNSPIDNFKTLSPATFNCSADTSLLGTTLVNMSLWNNLTGISQTTSLTGIINNTIFTQTFPVGNYLWNCLACDNSSICGEYGTNRTIIIANLVENSQTYKSAVTSGELQNLSINFSYNSAAYTGISVKLVYNNTNYSAPLQLASGNTLVFSSTLITPYAAAITLNPFYWNIMLTNSTGSINIITNSINQTVSPLVIDNCAANTLLLFNMTLFDQDLLTPLNGTIQTLITLYTPGTTSTASIYNNSFNYIYGTDAKICVSNFSGSYDLGYLIKFYSNTSLYFQQYKTIQRLTITNATATQNLQLYDLLGTSGYSFVVKVRGSDIPNNANILVDAQRQYIGLGLFKSIESTATDNSGDTIIHLVQASVYYNFIVSSDGKILGAFNNMKPICDNPSTGSCTIYLNLAAATAGLPDFNNYGNVSILYLLNNRTLTTSFVTTDGTIKTISQIVIRNDGYGNTTVCPSSTTTGTSGTFICDIPVIYSDSVYISQIFVDGVLVGTKIFSLDSGGTSVFFGIRTILMLLLYSCLVMLFISNPVMIVIGAVLGFTIGAFLLYVDGGSTLTVGLALGWMIIAAVVIIYQMSKRI